MTSLELERKDKVSIDQAKDVYTQKRSIQGSGGKKGSRDLPQNLLGGKI